jgi:hypothetical protein
VKSERFNSLVEGVEELRRSFTKGQLEDPKYAISEIDSELLNRTLKYYKGKKQNCESFHKGMSLKMIYDKLVEERDNYGWRVKTDTFEDLGYDVKFGYHLIRILAEGYQLLKTGELMYPIMGVARDDIVAVREGKVELPELLKMYDRYDFLCRKAAEETELRKKPDFNWANNWLIRVLKDQVIQEYLEEKKSKKNIEIIAQGIKCDNPDCDYMDVTVPYEDYKEWVNKPCPKCGANLLTEEDFAGIELVQSLIDVGNMLPPQPGPKARMRVSLDGKGNISMSDVEILKSDS